MLFNHQTFFKKNYKKTPKFFCSGFNYLNFNRLYLHFFFVQIEGKIHILTIEIQ